MYLQYDIECFRYIEENKFGVSSINEPKNHTVVYIAEKLKDKINLLKEVNNCFVFFQSGISIPEHIQNMHTFCEVENPSEAFGEYMIWLSERNRKPERGYRHIGGYVVGENVKIGKNTIIEPNVLIDHDVEIGENCLISYGTVIRHSIIGNNCEIFENTIIGNTPYNFFNRDGVYIRIPAIGGVLIGDNVSVGANTVVDRGTTTHTIIGNNSKIDVNCEIGHDAVIGNKVLITGCSVIGSFSKVGAESHVYSSKIIKRTIVGKHTEICFNSCVFRNVPDNKKVFGYPAKKI